ncbi:hypothetical protein TNCV_4785891 [Trichonephila clavipes]|nr:hypothetical protein TNCV_4785891 [Trichonephila clavipes]
MNKQLKCRQEDDLADDTSNPSYSSETKLPVRLINTTNERKLVQRHETPLRVKGDIEDVSGELDNGGLRMHFLDEMPRIRLLLLS